MKRAVLTDERQAVDPDHVSAREGLPDCFERRAVRLGAPEGDNVANLLKYYFRMAGDAPAISSRLPKGSLLTVSNAQYLAITYERDKLVSDVVCTAEVGSGMVGWSSGPSFTRVEQVLDLGAVEKVTVRDLVASGNSGQRFMRLRFSRL